MTRKGTHYRAMKSNIAMHMAGVVEGYADATHKSMDDAEPHVIDAMREVLAEMERVPKKKKWWRI